MKVIAMILAILISFTNIDISFAQDNVKNYKFENKITMNGVTSNSSKYFFVENNWNVEKVNLNLFFTKSELLDVDYSTITILVNNTPIYSQRLDGKKVYKEETNIEIPKDLIKKGYNEVRIRTYKTISDKVCRDDANTANWLVIHEDSNINIKYGYKPYSNSINNYSNIYASVDNGSRLNTTILIPDNYSDAQVNAGMIISSGFGEKIKNDNFNIDFKLYSDYKKNNDNIIYIGDGENSSSDILNLLSDDERNNLDNHCVIKQVNSSYDKNKKRLLIISNNKELLIKASKLIISKDLIKNLNQDTILITKDTKVEDLGKESNASKIDFKDLGYTNILLKGPFSQEVVMDINIPKSKVVGPGSKINLNIRYAQNLDFERSLATIYINDTPIGSKKLYKEKSNDDSIEITLPNDVLGKNYYQLKVVFNLELLDLECVTRDTDNPWAYILDDSYIELEYSDNNKLKFNTYPYPFIDSSKFNDTTIVIPSNAGSRELSYIADMISYMGHDIKYNSGNLNVIKSKNFNESYKNDNLIVIGTPNSNTLIKDINKNLNIKFNEDYKGYESNEKISFVGDYSSQISSIQLINSPYNKNNSMMVLSSTEMKDLRLGAKYLSDSKLVQRIKGDTVVVDRNGNIKDLNYKAYKSDKSNEDKKYNINISTQTKQFIVMAGFILFTVIICTVFLIRKYRK